MPRIVSIHKQFKQYSNPIPVNVSWNNKLDIFFIRLVIPRDLNFQMDPQPRTLKNLNRQDRISKRQRCIVLTPMDCETLVKALPLFSHLRIQIFFSALNGVVNEDSLELLESIRQTIIQALTYENRSDIITPVRPRYTLKPCCKTVTAAMQACKTIRKFEETFGFKPEEVVDLAKLLLPEFITFPANWKKGRVGREEALLVVLARFRNATATLEQLDDIFERSGAWSSTVVRSTVAAISERYGRLLASETFPKFAPYFDMWERAIRDKYNEYASYTQHELYSSLPWRFTEACVFLDGMRQSVARPCHEQELFYSAHTGDHNLNRIIITSPCGLILYASDPVTGRHVDQFAYNTAGIEAVLESANAKAIADKGFTPSLRCASLPKITEMNPLSQSQMTALSAVRTAGVRPSIFLCKSSAL